MDLVANFIDQLGHVGVMDDLWRHQQVVRYLKPLLDHPLYKAAEQRRRDRFWARCGRTK